MTKDASIRLAHLGKLILEKWVGRLYIYFANVSLRITLRIPNINNKAFCFIENFISKNAKGNLK